MVGPPKRRAELEPADWRHAASGHRGTSGSVHARWLVTGVMLGFLVPYLFADRLALPKDVYYAVYSTCAIGLFVAWALSTGQELRKMFGRRVVLSVTLGIIFAALMALVVLGEPAGPRPRGAELAWAVVWRGLVYGVADGVLLSSFPILVVHAAFASTTLKERVIGKLGIGALALGASLAMTAVYHLGYADFRSAKVAKPVMGDIAWSIPTLVTLNPIGAPIAHAGLHVTAVLHNYDTELFLPPHR